MPRKNKEEYNAYMRDYLRKKTLKNRIETRESDDDFDATASGKPVLDIRRTPDLIRETKELLKSDKPNPEAEDDPVLKIIDKYGKYIPLVMEFFKGIQGSVSQINQQQAPTIQPPSGWLNLSPIQKLNYKYSRPEWYAAGEAYDLALETGNMNPQINTTYVDPTYQSPQSLQQLARKYPEPPMASSLPPVQPQTQQQTPKSDGAMRESLTVEETKSAEAQTQSADSSPKTSEMEKALIEDNLKYLDLGANFINKLSDVEFENHLKNIDKLVEKAKPFIPLIPVQVKGMIVQTNKDILENLFKEKCPKKYELIVKKKKVKKLLELFDKLKSSIV